MAASAHQKCSFMRGTNCNKALIGKIFWGGGRLRGMIAQEGLTVDGFRIEGKERIFLRKTDIRVSFVFLTLSITILKVK